MPKLRFPEFKNAPNWQEKQLGEIGEFYKGKGISKADIDSNGIIKCIRYGELYTTYGEVIDEVHSRTSISRPALFFSRKNDVILPSSGETKIDIATASCVRLDDIALGGDINVIRPQMDGTFLSYYLNGAKKYEIASIAQGDTVVHLYANKLMLINVLIPESLEQQKIADCLSSLDDIIAAEDKKLEALKSHKKGLMQKLFPAEGKTVPEWRFPEFRDSGAWEKKTIGSSCASFSGGTPDTSKREYYDGEIPFIRSAEIDRETTELSITKAGFDNSATKMVQKGDVLVALYGANSGEVSLSKIDGAINQAILCLRHENNNAFVYQYLFHKKLWIISTYIQGGQGNLSGEIVKSIELYFSKPDEQQRIAECLSGVDDLISEQTQKVETLKHHKKGLMQGLFPSIEEVGE